jgi:transcriptional regulator with XRE-family HTH domain
MPALAACPELKPPRGIAMSREEFAARLREMREEKGITQEELAVKAGVSLDAVTRWERGVAEPGWTKLVALADALEVSLEAFRQPPTGGVPPRKRGRPKKQPPAEPPEGKPRRRGKG